eukprot:Lankesteria_metandrocarpae@DN5131_c0_g1_i1.p1
MHHPNSEKGGYPFTPQYDTLPNNADVGGMTHYPHQQQQHAGTHQQQQHAGTHQLLSAHGDIEEPILPVARRRPLPVAQTDAQAALLRGFVNEDESGLKGNSWSQVKDALLDEMKSATEPITSWFGGFWGSKTQATDKNGRQESFTNTQYSFEEGVTPLVTVNRHGSAYGRHIYSGNTVDNGYHAHRNFNESVSLRATETVRIVDSAGEVHIIPRPPGNQAAVGVVYGSQEQRSPRGSGTERKRPARSLMARANDLGNRTQQQAQDYFGSPEYNGGGYGGVPYNGQQGYDIYNQDAQGMNYEEYYNATMQNPQLVNNPNTLYNDTNAAAMYSQSWPDASGNEVNFEGYLTALLDAVDKYRRSNPHGCPSDASLDGDRRIVRSASLTTQGSAAADYTSSFKEECSPLSELSSSRIGRSFSLHRCFRNTGHRLIVRRTAASESGRAYYLPSDDPGPRDAYGGHVPPHGGYGRHMYPPDAYGYGRWNQSSYHPSNMAPGGHHQHPGDGGMMHGQTVDQQGMYYDHNELPPCAAGGIAGGTVYDPQQYYGAPMLWPRQPNTDRKASGASTDYNLTAADGLNVSAPLSSRTGVDLHSSTGAPYSHLDGAAMNADSTADPAAGSGGGDVQQTGDTTGTNNNADGQKSSEAQEADINEALNLYTPSEISKIRLFVQKVHKVNFEGWLEKSNPSGWGYKTRFVRIRYFEMAYMKSPHDENALGTLKLASSVWHAEARQDANSFSMKAEDDSRIYLWRLPQASAHTRSQWLDAIRKCFKAVAFVRQLKDIVDCRKPDAAL